MNVFRQLEKEHSKENSLKIISHIGSNPLFFKELMDCFFMETKDYRVPQRAAHTVSLSFDKNPELIGPYIPQLVGLLEKPDLRGAHKRNILRILQFCEVGENLRGILYSRTFELLADPKEEIAVRAFAMTVLCNIAKHHPELKSELRAMIETVLDEPGVSAGVRSRGAKTLAVLNKEKD